MPSPSSITRKACSTDMQPIEALAWLLHPPRTRLLHPHHLAPMTMMMTTMMKRMKMRKQVCMFLLILFTTDPSLTLPLPPLLLLQFFFFLFLSSPQHPDLSKPGLILSVITIWQQKPVMKTASYGKTSEMRLSNSDLVLVFHT